MPLYEYECAKCGHGFEKIESFSASPTKKCPKCGGKAERQLSSSSVQFKGSGWYATDYAGKSGGEVGKKDEKVESPAESKPPASSESKPATSAESKPSTSPKAAKKD